MTVQDVLRDALARLDAGVDIDMDEVVEEIQASIREAELLPSEAESEAED